MPMTHLLAILADPAPTSWGMIALFVAIAIVGAALFFAVGLDDGAWDWPRGLFSGLAVVMMFGGTVLVIRAASGNQEIESKALAREFASWQVVPWQDTGNYQPGVLPSGATVTPDPKPILARYPGTSISQVFTTGPAGVRTPSFFVALPVAAANRYHVDQNLVMPLKVTYPGTTQLVVIPDRAITSRGSVVGLEWTGVLGAKVVLDGHTYPYGAPVHGVLTSMDPATANGGYGAWIGVEIDQVDQTPVRGSTLFIGQDPDGLATAIAKAKEAVGAGATGKQFSNMAWGAALGGALASKGNAGRGAATGALIGSLFADLDQAAEEAKASEAAKRSVPAALIPGYAYGFQVRPTR